MIRRLRELERRRRMLVARCDAERAAAAVAAAPLVRGLELFDRIAALARAATGAAVAISVARRIGRWASASR